MRAANFAPHLLYVALGTATAEVLPESVRYLEFPEVLPGKVLKAKKQLDPATGRITLVSNLPEVANVGDLLAMESAQENVRRQAHGALDPRLVERLPDLGLLGRARVAIRIKTREVPFLDKTKSSLEDQIANAQARAVAGPVISPSTFALANGLLPLEARGENVVIVEAGRSQLELMKANPNVAAIWEDRDMGPSAELTSAAASAYNPGPVPSGTGSGVRAATFEYGLTSTFLSCIGVSPSAYDASGFEDNLKRHSQVTFRTLAAAAPSANLYHRKSWVYNGSGDVSYLVNNGIQTVSISMHRGASSPHRATYSEFLTMDEMAYSYPYTVFSNPTHNLGYGYEVNWQGYNGLSVGNVRHTNESTFEMVECMQAKNPPPRYGSCIAGSGADCAGDREMPHLLAPGAPPTGTTFGSTCLEGTGSVGCGTSISAPIANGAAAALIAADSRLASWPEKVRATLILTAQNVDGGEWVVGTDDRDGTGVISVADAVAFAQGHTSVAPGNTAAVSGMGASSFYAADFSAAKRFYFQVPNPKPSGKHLRVVLTWDSNPVVNNGTNDLSDLDLSVQHNSGTSYSSSWDSNVEVVDIPAANLTAGSGYYIDVSPYANRIPSSGVNYFYYAVAWTWVKDHAP